MMGRTLLLLPLLLAGCGDAFEPFTPEPPGVALYGLLDARADTQWVRAQALRRTPSAPAPRPTVTLSDPAAGPLGVYRDTTVVLYNGQPQPTFYLVFRPEAGRAYRLTATRPDASDGGTTAVVTVPHPPVITLLDLVVINERFQQLLTVGEIDGRPFDGLVTYRLQRAGGQEVLHRVRYTVETAGGTQPLRIFLSRDADAILAAFGEPLRLLDLRLDLSVERPAVPTEGGPGEVAAVARFGRSWTIPFPVAQAIGLDG